MYNNIPFGEFYKDKESGKMDDAAAVLELFGRRQGGLNRGECFHMFDEGPCIGLRNDSINEHLETGQTFTRMGVLSKQNDRNVWHYLL